LDLFTFFYILSYTQAMSPCIDLGQIGIEKETFYWVECRVGYQKRPAMGGNFGFLCPAAGHYPKNWERSDL